MTKTLLDKYNINLNDILVEIKVVLKSDEFVPQYVSTISNISETTKIVLEKIREEFIRTDSRHHPVLFNLAVRLFHSFSSQILRQSLRGAMEHPE